MRLISDQNISDLKGVTDACYRLGGGVTSFSLLTRVGTSTLVKYASWGDRRADGRHEHADTMIPIDIALEADLRAKSPVILTELARLQGYQLAPLADVADAERVSEADAHRVLYEATDVSRAILEACGDGKLDALERKRIGKEAREAIRALEAVLRGLELDGDE